MTVFLNSLRATVADCPQSRAKFCLECREIDLKIQFLGIMNNSTPDKAVSDAANLLLRLGLVVAFVGAPLALLVSQRSIFILTPIAGALMLAAGFIVAPRLRLREIFAFFASRVGLAALFLGFWAALSLLWTPFPGEAAPRLLKIFTTFLAVLPVAALLPPRTKAANLYLLPLGVALAAFGAILLNTFASADEDAPGDAVTMLRAVEGMLLLLWPALAATALRNRLTLSASLAIVVLAAAIAVQAPAAWAATAMAALAFTAGFADARRTGRVLGALGAISFIFAPALPLLVGPFFRPDSPTAMAGVRVWFGLIGQDGPRILTGHGFNFVGSGSGHNYLSPDAPHSILFEAWTDLGLIGALAGAAVLYFAYEEAASQSPRLAPFWLGGLTFVLGMGVFGAATLQLWWISALALTLAGFALTMRGDFKTARPTAPKLAA
jgi:hypothetical protein